MPVEQSQINYGRTNNRMYLFFRLNNANTLFQDKNEDLIIFPNLFTSEFSVDITAEELTKSDTLQQSLSNKSSCIKKLVRV